MKRLLLPLLAALALPTAVNAFPFGKNLEFKNDIGTKTLIKGDAVNSEYLTVEDLETAINSFKKKALKLRWKKLDYENDDRKRNMNYLEMYSKGGILEDSDVAEEQAYSWKYYVEENDRKINEIKKKYKERTDAANLALKKIIEDDQLIKIQAVNLIYNPIRIDLNNNQTIQSEVGLTCFNPKLTKEFKNIWLDFYPYEGGENEREQAICKKYAKFK